MHANTATTSRPPLAPLNGAGIRWSADDEAAANAEGWCVSRTSDGFDEIQKLDDAARFTGDSAAIAHVYWMVGTGSDLHRRALLFTLRAGNRWPYNPALTFPPVE